MKKILLIILALSIGATSCERYILEETGFYGAYVRKMPFWKFWNRNKVIKAIAEFTHKTSDDIRLTIDMKIPVLMTKDYEQAEKLKNELIDLGCELEILEIKFSFVDKEAAEQHRAIQAMMKFVDEYAAQ